MDGLELALLLVTCSFGVHVCEGAIKYAVKPDELGQCPSFQERERVRAEISAEVKEILSAPLYSCNGSPGWRRVGFVNMTDPSQDCPPGLNLTIRSCGSSHYDNLYNILDLFPSHPRSCGSSHHTYNECSSTTFSVSGVQYSQVCGRIRAYQCGCTIAFAHYLYLHSSLEESYVDGVSLTHGAAGERQHIWTFAAGISEGLGVRYFDGDKCPNDFDGSESPSFVNGDYFCESGNNDDSRVGGVFFERDPLWDGEGCGFNITSCQFNNPPYFSKILPAPTTDDIELRLCHCHDTFLADVPIELVELYIK